MYAKYFNEMAMDAWAKKMFQASKLRNEGLPIPISL